MDKNKSMRRCSTGPDKISLQEPTELLQIWWLLKSTSNNNKARRWKHRLRVSSRTTLFHASPGQQDRNADADTTWEKKQKKNEVKYKLERKEKKRPHKKGARERQHVSVTLHLQAREVWQTIDEMQPGYQVMCLLSTHLHTP